MAEMTLRVRDSETEDETTAAGKRLGPDARERTKLRASSHNLIIFGDEPDLTVRSHSHVSL
jgi:hypothetical protein